MLNTNQSLIGVGRLRGLQMIIGAMALGIVGLLAVAAFSPIGQGDPDDGEGKATLLTMIAVAGGVMSLPIGLLLPAIVVKAGRDKIAGALSQQAGAETRTRGSSDSNTSNRLQNLYQVKTILAAAMFEAAALLAGIAYMLEHQVPALGVAGVMSICIIIQLPTQDRFGHWIENQQRRVEEARQLRGNPHSS